MNNFERIAIFTMIEGIEAQFRGLKTLLAAGNNQVSAHTTTAVPQHDPMASAQMSEADEAALAAHLGMLRQQEIEKMQHKAGEKFGEIWQETAEKVNEENN